MRHLVRNVTADACSRLVSAVLMVNNKLDSQWVASRGLIKVSEVVGWRAGEMGVAVQTSVGIASDV